MIYYLIKRKKQKGVSINNLYKTSSKDQKKCFSLVSRLVTYYPNLTTKECLGILNKSLYYEGMFELLELWGNALTNTEKDDILKDILEEIKE